MAKAVIVIEDLPDTAQFTGNLGMDIKITGTEKDADGRVKSTPVLDAVAHILAVLRANADEAIIETSASGTPAATHSMPGKVQ